MTTLSEIDATYRHKDGDLYTVIAVERRNLTSNSYPGDTREVTIVWYREAGWTNRSWFCRTAEHFAESFTHACSPMKRCAFCGFMRFEPCTTRQPCPNLGP